MADAVLAMGNFQGTNTPVNGFIESDSGGLPGNVLSTLTQVGTIPPFSSGGGLVTYTRTTGCNLGAGNYWLVAMEPMPLRSR